jgi:uncharacterized protein (DUF302 family)
MGPHCQLLVAGYWLLASKNTFLLVPVRVLLVEDKEKTVIDNE